MRTAIPLTVLATALACSLAAAPANARARVFVASYGNDSNPCTFGSPCKTFQQAVNVVDPGGEVTAIDSAGFGPINITKAVTITSPAGVEAGIVPVAGGDAIDITAGSTDAVVLSGLTLNGSGIGTNGIVFNSGGTLNVRDNVIQNFANNGINFVPTTQSTLSVSNTVVADNGVYGIAMKPNNSGSVVFVGTFTRVEAYHNGTSGIAVIGDLASTQTHQGVNAIAIDCIATGNNYASTSTGFLATSSQGIALFRLFRSTAAGNFVGASAVSTNNAVVAIGLSQSNMELSRSSASASGTNAVVQSYGDNFTGGQTIAGSTLLTE
jgi:hypothetical protein